MEDYANYYKAGVTVNGLGVNEGSGHLLDFRIENNNRIVGNIKRAFNGYWGNIAQNMADFGEYKWIFPN